MTAALSGAAAAARVSSRRPRIGRGLSRAAKARPEGRWSRISESSGDRDAVCSAWAGALLARYGVLSRETAALDPLAPSWKDLAMVLSRAEILGEVRRGFFVEGLSGVQYATAEAAEALAARAGDRSADTESILISTLDPANLYGSGAPFDINLLEGGTARLTRSNASYLVLRGGRPVLIIEGHGKRLTGLNSASEAELRSAIALLPSLAKAPRRVLKVETYNTAATLASPAEPWLADAGFVRDYPGMAYYARW